MFQERIRVHPLADVVAVDIDGTIADYHKHFKWFAELYLRRELPLNWDGVYKFHEALGLPIELYRDIKLAYRQGGLKRSLPMFQASPQTISRIRQDGYQVWICTTRPYLRLDNIDKDTQFWLDHNNIHYDGVLFGEDKYEDLVDIVGKERILCVFDDLPEQVQRAARLGLNVAMRTGPHNEWAQELGVPHVVNNSFEMYEFFRKCKESKESSNE